jgi:2-polyprenyl-3-methyl-5-hydroxy-6-metoxy-1,4-benzoquinol methylase
MDHTDRRFNQTTDRYAADDLETIREARRYGAHVFELFRPHIGTRVLEVGCGIGTMSEKLAAMADMIVGIEPNAACIDRVAAAMRHEPKFSLRPCHLEECDPAELRGQRFDTVYCVNVLEHLEHDVAALQLFREIIVPHGKVLIFVPAVPAAYGPLDAELGHHRRYSKQMLSRVFASAGLEVVMLRYTNPIGLAGWMYNAHVSKSRVHSLSQVKLFERLVAPWALPLERLITPPIGLSLMAVGTVNAASARP